MCFVDPLVVSKTSKQDYVWTHWSLTYMLNHLILTFCWTIIDILMVEPQRKKRRDVLFSDHCVLLRNLSSFPIIPQFGFHGRFHDRLSKYDGSTIPIGSHETGIFTRVSMVFRGLTTYLYWGYNPVTKYHGHPSTYIWLNFMVDVGKYTIHGCYGYDDSSMYKLYTVRFYQQSQ